MKMFGTVPPIGRCAKKFTSSSWLLLVITVLEGG